METRSLSQALQSELASRIERNPRYSLRAFARALGVEPGALSRIISGKRLPTPETLERLLSALGLEPEAQAGLRQSAIQSKRRGPRGGRGKAEVLRYDELSPEIFRVISDVTHYAILNLPATGDADADPRRIAARLGISPSEAKLAVTRLAKLGLLRIDAGKLVRTRERLATAHPSITTPAYRRHQRQVLERAAEALESVPLERRSSNSMTFAIDERKIPQAKRLIDKFLDQMSALLETGNRRSVYQVGVQLFPLERGSMHTKKKTRK